MSIARGCPRAAAARGEDGARRTLAGLPLLRPRGGLTAAATGLLRGGDDGNNDDACASESVVVGLGVPIAAPPAPTTAVVAQSYADPPQRRRNFSATSALTPPPPTMSSLMRKGPPAPRGRSFGSTAARWRKKAGSRQACSLSSSWRFGGGAGRAGLNRPRPPEKLLRQEGAADPKTDGLRRLLLEAGMRSSSSVSFMSAKCGDEPDGWTRRSRGGSAGGLTLPASDATVPSAPIGANIQMACATIHALPEENGSARKNRSPDQQQPKG
jgi:hypothetical protein